MYNNIKQFLISEAFIIYLLIEPVSGYRVDLNEGALHYE